MARCFIAVELKLLICGSDEIDAADWHANTEYKDGLAAVSPTVARFWAVVAAFDQPDRAALLKFTTGSARPPGTGFGSLMGYDGNRKRFQIGSTQCSEWTVTERVARLPTASTCFNTLYLPDYPDEKTLREKLLQAIQSDAGFDEAAVAVKEP